MAEELHFFGYRGTRNRWPYKPSKTFINNKITQIITQLGEPERLVLYKPISFSKIYTKRLTKGNLAEVLKPADQGFRLAWRRSAQ